MKRNISVIYCVMFTLGITAVLFAQEQNKGPVTTPASSPQLQEKFPTPQTVNQELSSSFRGMNPRNLARMRDDLTNQLRELSRVLTQIDPRDSQFADQLREEQNSMLEQLRAVNAQLKELDAEANPANPIIKDAKRTASLAEGLTEPTPRNARPENLLPGLPLTEIPATTTTPATFPTFPGTFPAEKPEAGFGFGPVTAPNVRNVATPTPAISEERKNQILETVRQLREVGLNDVADDMMRQLETTATPAITAMTAAAAAQPTPAAPRAMPLTPNQSYYPVQPGNPGIQPVNPWAIPPAQEVVELKATVTALQAEIQQLRNDIKSMETQLKLLNENILLKSR